METVQAKNADVNVTATLLGCPVNNCPSLFSHGKTLDAPEAPWTAIPCGHTICTTCHEEALRRIDSEAMRCVICKEMASSHVFNPALCHESACVLPHITASVPETARSQQTFSNVAAVKSAASKAFGDAQATFEASAAVFKASATSVFDRLFETLDAARREYFSGLDAEIATVSKCLGATADALDISSCQIAAMASVTSTPPAQFTEQAQQRLAMVESVCGNIPSKLGIDVSLSKFREPAKIIWDACSDFRTSDSLNGTLKFKNEITSAMYCTLVKVHEDFPFSADLVEKDLVVFVSRALQFPLNVSLRSWITHWGTIAPACEDSPEKFVRWLDVVREICREVPLAWQSASLIVLAPAGRLVRDRFPNDAVVGSAFLNTLADWQEVISWNGLVQLSKENVHDICDAVIGTACRHFHHAGVRRCLPRVIGRCEATASCVCIGIVEALLHARDASVEMQAVACLLLGPVKASVIPDTEEAFMALANAAVITMTTSGLPGLDCNPHAYLESGCAVLTKLREKNLGALWNVVKLDLIRFLAAFEATLSCLETGVDVYTACLSLLGYLFVSAYRNTNSRRVLEWKNVILLAAQAAETHVLDMPLLSAAYTLLELYFSRGFLVSRNEWVVKLHVTVMNNAILAANLHLESEAFQSTIWKLLSSRPTHVHVWLTVSNDFAIGVLTKAMRRWMSNFDILSLCLKCIRWCRWGARGRPSSRSAGRRLIDALETTICAMEHAIHSGNEVQSLVLNKALKALEVVITVPRFSRLWVRRGGMKLLTAVMIHCEKMTDCCARSAETLSLCFLVMKTGMLQSIHMGTKAFKEQVGIPLVLRVLKLHSRALVVQFQFWRLLHVISPDEQIACEFLVQGGSAFGCSDTMVRTDWLAPDMLSETAPVQNIQEQSSLSQQAVVGTCGAAIGKVFCYAPRSLIESPGLSRSFLSSGPDLTAEFVHAFLGYLSDGGLGTRRGRVQFYVFQLFCDAVTNVIQSLLIRQFPGVVPTWQSSITRVIHCDFGSRAVEFLKTPLHAEIIALTAQLFKLKIFFFENGGTWQSFSRICSRVAGAVVVALPHCWEDLFGMHIVEDVIEAGVRIEGRQFPCPDAVHCIRLVTSCSVEARAAVVTLLDKDRENIRRLENFLDAAPSNDLYAAAKCDALWLVNLWKDTVDNCAMPE